MPNSAPEVSSIDEMPKILKCRVKLFDDSYEIDASHRILHGLRKEFGVVFTEDGIQLKFKSKSDRDIRSPMVELHSLVRKLAIGFNHSLQVDIELEKSIELLRFMRGKVLDGQTRVILAQLEAVLGTYSAVNFDAPSLVNRTKPSDTILMFDRLINDETYLEYSHNIARLSDPLSRNDALMHIRLLGGKIRKFEPLSAVWNYVAKVISVSAAGIPVPDTGLIASLVKNRPLPSIIDLTQARSKAFCNWSNTNKVETPLDSKGNPVVGGEVQWMSPSLGTKMINPQRDDVVSINGRKLRDALSKLLDKED
ncbi:hypothetical protein AUQ42_00375 [Thalassospira sp. MCCC 1A02491]|nr:hypothetical protein AUQ42_00375 [Thalassospira sp. MCCC 1A02491]